jgi:uncharacterized protein
MSLEHGGIDCDIHPAVPEIASLLPYLSEYWRDTVVQRGVHELNSIAYPYNAPLSARPDWRTSNKRPGSDLSSLRKDALDRFRTRIAICNCLYGVHLLFSEDMAAGFAQAVNDWIAREWLDREPRLRSSIVVPLQNPEMAVVEIEHRAADRRFVAVLVPAMGEVPLGKRMFWPVYAAAERHGLPICIHAGSAYRHPVTSVGWPSYYTEDYAAQAVAFQSQLTSLICEGVFSKFSTLRVVLAESGITWLPAYLWRLNKYWRGLRTEIPWVDVPPIDLVRRHVRFTLQPVDAPPGDIFGRILEHLGGDDLLLFSTDYPHWQFDGNEVLPEALRGDLAHKIMVENPRKTYPRIEEAVR